MLNPASQETPDDVLAQLDAEMNGSHGTGVSAKPDHASPAPVRSPRQMDGGKLARYGVSPGTDALMELGAKQGWAGGEADPSDVDQAKRDAEFHEIRDAIEQIMQYKVAQRRSVQAAFGWDIAQLVFYCAFLVLFSVNNSYNPSTYSLYNTKSIIAGAFFAKGGLGGVTSIAGIYEYLENTVVPSVAARNVTLIDARCTSDGRHANPVCLQDPFSNEAQCCYTAQPNKGIFSPGSHTKNLLLTPVRIRQQRVRSETAVTPLGGSFVMRWPVLSSKTEETRDGGGTIADHDTQGLLRDWPEQAGWFKYYTCAGHFCAVDSRLGNPNSFPRPAYSQSGYVAVLNGTAETMLAELARMRKYEFLGGSTRGVFVDFTAYFPGDSLFATVSILFEVGAADVVVSPSISIRVSDLRQPGSPTVAGGWVLVDYAVLAYAATLMLIDMYKLCRAPKEYLRQAWNVLSWINFAIFGYVFYLLLLVDMGVAGIEGLVPMSADATAYPWAERMESIDLFLQYNSVNCILSWLRLIRYLEQMSPSTQQLTRTISSSAADLGVFIMMLFIVLFGFIQAFNLQFGSQVNGYASTRQAATTLFQMLLGEFDFKELEKRKLVSPEWALLYFAAFIVVVVFMMFNMVIAIIMKTYDAVASELVLKARTEVTGFSILSQSVKTLMRLVSARTLDDLKKVSPEDSALDSSLSGLYGQERDLFDRDFVTEHEFRALFQHDDDALNRMGVRSVEELVMYADVTGKPRLDMREVHEYREKVNMLAGRKQKDEDLVVFAPMQLAQIRKTTEQAIEAALDDSVKALKTYVHNQISQATLVLSGSSMGNAALGAPPGVAPSDHAHEGHPAPPLAGLRSSPLLKPSVDLGM